MYNRLLLKCLPGQMKCTPHEEICWIYRPTSKTKCYEIRFIAVEFSILGYRSGWYSIGLLKVFGPCDVDLMKKNQDRKVRITFAVTMHYNNYHVAIMMWAQPSERIARIL